MPKLTKFDAADYLDDPETIAAYLTEAFETGDQAYIVQALSTVARAKGMTQIAEKAGVSRESLYKSLSGNSNPEFNTVRKVLDSMGMKLVVKAA